MSQDGNGRIILWITFGLMVGSAIGFTIMGAMKPMNMRSHACEAQTSTSDAHVTHVSLGHAKQQTL